MAHSPPVRIFLRLLKWILFTVLLLAIAVPLLFFFLPEEAIRAAIGGKASSRMGRDLAIEGPLKITPHLSHVRIQAEDIVLTNLPQSRDPEMVRIGKLDLSLKYWKLLTGTVDIPSLRLEEPKIVLEKFDPDTRNWKFGMASEESIAADAALPDDRGSFPLIGSLVITNGTFIYRDLEKGMDVDLELNTATADGESEAHFEIKGSGSLQDRKFTLEATGGSLSMLRDTSLEFPLKFNLVMGATRVTVDGRFTDPVRLTGMDASLDLRGDTLSDLFYLTGIPLPPTPPYSLSGHLAKNEKVWRFADFNGRGGDSNLAGDLTYDTGGERGFLTATLTSDLLDADDLGGFIGLTPSTKSGERAAPRQRQAAAEREASGRLLPDVPLKLERLRAADMDVSLKATRINAPGWPLENMDVRFLLDNGLLRIKPLNFAMADGLVEGDLVLDGRKDVPAVDIDMQLKRLSLRQFFKSSRFEDLSAGRFGGRIDLAGEGRSLAEVLSVADGRLVVVMGGGKVSLLLIEASNIDLVEAAGLFLGEDNTTDIRCGIVDFKVTDGYLDSQAFVFDTSDTMLAGDLNINLKNEAVDAEIRAQPKDPSPFALQSPITVGGTLRHPSIGIDIVTTGLRGAAAAVLGTVLTPVAALIPFIEPGLGEDAHCRELIATARHNMETSASQKTPARAKAESVSPGKAGDDKAKEAKEDAESGTKAGTP